MLQNPLPIVQDPPTFDPKRRKSERQQMELGPWLPLRLGPTLPAPESWHIATDGSGQQIRQDGNMRSIAGWGVVIFRAPVCTDVPDYVLHAPVVTEPWDHLWMGARECTNNTGEVSSQYFALQYTMTRNTFHTCCLAINDPEKQRAVRKSQRNVEESNSGKNF